MAANIPPCAARIVQRADTVNDLYFNAVIWILTGIALIVFSQRKDRYPESLITLENPAPEKKPKRESWPILILGIVQVVLGVLDFGKAWMR